MQPPHADARNELLRAVLAASSDVVVVVDDAGVFSYVNDALRRVLGQSPEHWFGRSVLGLVHPGDADTVSERFAAAWVDPDAGATPVAFRAAHGSGGWVDVEVVGTDRLELPDTKLMVMVIRDVSHRARAERRLRQVCRELDFAVTHDPLTLLPNREILLARLGALARRVGSSERAAHVILLKVCAVDELRELHGIDETTTIVRALAARLRASVPATDFVAADGIGDFVVAIAPGTPPSEIDELAKRLLRLADVPLSSEQQRVELQLAVGVAMLGPDGDPAATLEEAGRAASWSRLQDPPSPVFFAELGRTEGVDGRRTANDVKRALVDGELMLWYQPIVDVVDRRVRGFEGLLRWLHPERGVLDAASFLPEVEGTATMIDIGEFVLREGCERLARWQQRLGKAAPTLALNISARQLRQGDIAARVGEQLALSGARAGGLCLELTETHALDREPSAVDELRSLRERGVRIGLDDFGTGYSSLHHLHEIRADVLKVDRAFVDRLGRDEGATAIVRASIEMGSAFGMTTVAEGVTTEPQLQLLASMGCDLVQGFLVAPAVPGDEADAMLDSETRESRGATRSQSDPAGAVPWHRPRPSTGVHQAAHDGDVSPVRRR